MSLFLNNKHQYWESHFPKLFYLVVNDKPIDRDWMLFVDYRAMDLWHFTKYLLSNLDNQVSIDSLDFIPIDAEDCYVLMFIFNELHKDIGYKLLYDDRKVMLVQS